MDAIRDFWDWFDENSDELAKASGYGSLVRQLDERVRRLGNFVWEIGPGLTKQHALVISPGGDLDLLEESKKIVGLAREKKDWEFHYAKPAKEWDMQFEFGISDGGPVSVDARNWEFVLLGYDDGMFELIIRAPEISLFEEEDRRAAAEILLDGLLGEETRMTLICHIDIVNEFDDAYRGAAANIAKLAYSFSSLKNGDNLSKR